MKIREEESPDAIAAAVAIDEALLGSPARADYIMSVAQSGGLIVAELHGSTQAFCCLDHRYFFGKPFISLLFVAPGARRLGLGAGLVSHCSSGLREVWTSTNRSNAAMCGLLDRLGWHYCGEVSGLDDGDPERFYRTG